MLKMIGLNEIGQCMMKNSLKMLWAFKYAEGGSNPIHSDPLNSGNSETALFYVSAKGTTMQSYASIDFSVLSFRKNNFSQVFYLCEKTKDRNKPMSSIPAKNA